MLKTRLRRNTPATQTEAEEQARRRPYVASSRRSSRASPVDNIEEEIEAHYARRAVREGKQPAKKEQGSQRDSAASSRLMSHALDNIEKEIEAECACRKQTEGQSHRFSVPTSPRPLRDPDEWTGEHIEAEYRRRAQKKAEEQQSRISSVASSRRSSRAPAMSIQEEVEALYASRNANYRMQVHGSDNDGIVTPRALSPSRRPSTRAPAASAPRSLTSPRYEEN
ncbi:hypothetical protein BDV09DRAFT_197129 [Aspergillus tetrazonus]